MKNSRIAVLLFTLILQVISPAAQSAVGDIIMWPTVTAANVVDSGGGVYTVTATVDMIPMRQTSSSNTTPHYFVLKIAGKTNNAYVPWITSGAYYLPGVTWQSISDDWKKNYGLHSTISSRLNSNGSGNYSGGCVALTLDFGSTNNSSVAWDGLVNSPGGIYKCTSIPISAFRCNVLQDSLTIDYGRVDSAEANGKTGNINFDINCDGPVNISITSSSGPTIYLAPGLTAALYMDGIPIQSKTISIPTGSSVHTLSTTLSASAPNAGTYSGQTALIINYQ